MKLPVLRRLGGQSTLLQEWGVTQPKDHNTIYTRESVCVSTYPRYSHHGRGKESREIQGTSSSEPSWEVCHEDTRPNHQTTVNNTMQKVNMLWLRKHCKSPEAQKQPQFVPQNLYLSNSMLPSGENHVLGKELWQSRSQALPSFLTLVEYLGMRLVLGRCSAWE